MIDPGRGEIWLADLNPARGHEQAGQRPVLIVSVNLFNQGPADLVIVLPVTTTARGIPAHVPVVPPEGGLRSRSYVMCEAVRSIAKDRLVKKWGVVSLQTMDEVEDRLRILLGL